MWLERDFMERIGDVEMIERVGGIKPNPLGEKIKAVADTMRNKVGDVTIAIDGDKLCKRKYSNPTCP